MLITCVGCQRHIRVHELACPFCGQRAAIEAPAALRGAALALALGAIGCGPTTNEQVNTVETPVTNTNTPPVNERPNDNLQATPTPTNDPYDREAVPAYGAPMPQELVEPPPPPPAPEPPSPPPARPPPERRVAPLYGAPAVRPTPQQRGPGGPAAAYGAPPADLDMPPRRK